MRVASVLAVALLLAPATLAADPTFPPKVWLFLSGPCVFSEDDLLCGPDHTVAASVSDAPGATLEVRVDGGAWEAYAQPVAAPAVTGEHVVEARAVEDGVVVASASRTVRVDATAPTIALEAPLVGWVYADFPVPVAWPSEGAAARGVAVFHEFGPVEGSVVDAGGSGFAGWHAWRDGDAAPLLTHGAATFDLSVALGGGRDHVLRFSAWDRVGNVATHVVTVAANEYLTPDCDPAQCWGAEDEDVPSGPPTARPTEQLPPWMPGAT